MLQGRAGPGAGTAFPPLLKVSRSPGVYSAERYDPLTGTWTSIAAMSTRRRYVRVAMLGGRLHCVAPSPGGSHTQRGHHECVLSLQMETCMPWVAMTAHHTWPPWRSMSRRCEIPQSHIPVPQRCLRSTLWPPLSPRGSSLYVHVVSQTPHPGVEVCTCREGGWWWVSPQPIPPPQVNSWTPVASMLSRRSSAGVAVLEGALYVAGGNDGTSCLNSVERYSPKAGAWESVAPMNIRRCTGPQNCHHHCPLFLQLTGPYPCTACPPPPS